MEDVFAVQEELTRSIVTALSPQVSAVEITKTHRPRPGSFSAYEIPVRACSNAQDAIWKADRTMRVLEETARAIHTCQWLGACRTWDRRLQIDRSGPFLATPLFENTGFLSHSWAMGLQIRYKLFSLGSILAPPLFENAFGAPSPTGS